jgi:hypothetical protein
VYVLYTTNQMALCFPQNVLKNKSKGLNVVKRVLSGIEAAEMSLKTQAAPQMFYVFIIGASFG